MPFHHWSDKAFDWKSLDDAVDIIYDTCIRWGRFGGQCKEKFGCIRFYVKFKPLSFEALIYPGYYYRKFPPWISTLDDKVFSPVLQFFFGKLWNKWQRKVYNWAYQRALRKYPHLWDEILCDADFPELIEGGQEVHDKYWTKHEPEKKV